MKRKILMLTAVALLTAPTLQARQVAPAGAQAPTQQAGVTQEGVLNSVNRGAGLITVSGKSYRYDVRSLSFSDRRKIKAGSSPAAPGVDAVRPGARVTIHGVTRDGVLRATHLIVHD